MRGHVVGLGLGVGLLALAGCAAPPQAVPVPSQPVEFADQPAGSAGGACRLLDFDVIEEVTTVRFDVSAASQHEQTRSCVVRAQTSSHPDLTLSLTDASADTEVFTEEIVPSGGKSVRDLGKAAYRATESGGSDRGPAAEVGWLTDDGTVASLRFTLAPGRSKDEADAMTPALVTLAKRLAVDPGQSPAASPSSADASPTSSLLTRPHDATGSPSRRGGAGPTGRGGPTALVTPDALVTPGALVTRRSRDPSLS